MRSCHKQMFVGRRLGVRSHSFCAHRFGDRAGAMLNFAFTEFSEVQATLRRLFLLGTDHQHWAVSMAHNRVRYAAISARLTPPSPRLPITIKPARNALLADVATPAVYGKAYGFERAMDNLGAIGDPLLALGLVAAIGRPTSAVLPVACHGTPHCCARRRADPFPSPPSGPSPRPPG